MRIISTKLYPLVIKLIEAEDPEDCCYQCPSGAESINYLADGNPEVTIDVPSGDNHGDKARQ